MPTESVIRRYDRDGNLIQEQFWNEEGLLVTRPTKLPKSLLALQPESFLVEPTATARFRTTVLAVTDFEAELHDYTLTTVIDSLWTDTSVGWKELSATATDPRAGSAAEFVFANPADAADISLSVSAVIFAAKVGTADEIVEFVFSPSDWAAVHQQIAADTTSPGISGIAGPFSEAGPGSQTLGSSEAARLAEADPCQLEGQIALIAMGRAAVLQGIAATVAPIPIANTVAEARAVVAVRQAVAAVGVWALCKWNHRNDPD